MPRATLAKKIFRNFGYKLTALGLATLVWYVVQGEEVLEVSAKLDVKIETPSTLALKDSAVVARDITLRGPRVLVGNMAGKNYLAIIRVPAGKSGNMRYRLDKEFIPRWDNRVRITIHDPYITFTVEERLTKMVAVKPTIIGDAEPPLALDEAIASPPEVEVSGAKSDVARMSELPTEPIDISHLKESKIVSTAISRASLPDVNVLQPNVRVSLRIGPKKSLKTISVVPIEITDADRRLVRALGVVYFRSPTAWQRVAPLGGGGLTN
jgi:YbbR domain-containing protein